jgi:hypothetical protein
MDKTGSKLQYSESGSSALRNWMRLQSSARITRSRMMGLASSESSHVLWITIVLWPPSRISDVYSSMARLLSPIENQALVGIVYICTHFTLLGGAAVVSGRYHVLEKSTASIFMAQDRGYKSFLP